MAKNAPVGDGKRRGMIKKRSQLYNSKIKKWVKRDTNTGKFIDIKQGGTPFKNVRKEKD